MRERKSWSWRSFFRVERIFWILLDSVMETFRRDFLKRFLWWLRREVQRGMDILFREFSINLGKMDDGRHFRRKILFWDLDAKE